MTDRKPAISAHTAGMPTIGGSVRALLSMVPNPAQYLRAHQALRRFRDLDDQRLDDIGLTRQQADQVTLKDFMNLKQPGS